MDILGIFPQSSADTALVRTVNKWIAERFAEDDVVPTPESWAIAGKTPDLPGCFVQ